MEKGSTVAESMAYLALELYLLFIVVWCVPFRKACFTPVIDQLFGLGIAEDGSSRRIRTVGSGSE